MYNQIYGPASALCPLCGKLMKECMGFCIPADALLINEKPSSILFDNFFEEVETAFKTGTVDICPNCKKITTIHTNPMYMHICDKCGWEGNYRDCKYKTTKDYVKEIVEKYYNK